MSDRHEPTPDFIERLEWQIRSELRRGERFEPPRTPWWRRRAVRTAALVAISIVVGFAGATFAQEGAERRALELLERESRLQLEMAELQLGLAADRLVWMEGLVLQGQASQGQLGLVEFQRDLLQREVTATRLDLEELRSTGRPARDDLAAPLVNGRDFVRERLELRLEGLQTELTVVTFQLEQIAGLVAEGRADALDRDRLGLEQRRILREIEHVTDTLELRARFLAGDLDEDEARARMELMAARRDLAMAEQQVTAARNRLDQIDSAPDLGEMERLAAETQLRMAEVQVEIAEARLRYLRQENRSPE